MLLVGSSFHNLEDKQCEFSRFQTSTKGYKIADTIGVFSHSHDPSLFPNLLKSNNWKRLGVGRVLAKTIGVGREGSVVLVSLSSLSDW